MSNLQTHKAEQRQKKSGVIPQSSPSYIIYYIERQNLKFTTVYILSTWYLIFPNRYLIYCTAIGELVTVNVNKGRSWELNTQGERDGPVTCKRGKCRKSAQIIEKLPRIPHQARRDVIHIRYIHMSVIIVCKFPFDRRSLCTLQQYFIKENWLFQRSRPSVLSLGSAPVY